MDAPAPSSPSLPSSPSSSITNKKISVEHGMDTIAGYTFEKHTVAKWASYPDGERLIKLGTCPFRAKRQQLERFQGILLEG